MPQELDPQTAADASAPAGSSISQKPKASPDPFPYRHLLAAAVVTVVYATLTYWNAVVDGSERYEFTSPAVAAAYVHGQLMAAFGFPLIICGIAAIPKGQRWRRVIICYWITCLILTSLALTNSALVESPPPGPIR